MAKITEQTFELIREQENDLKGLIQIRGNLIMPSETFSNDLSLHRLFATNQRTLRMSYHWMKLKLKESLQS